MDWKTLSSEADFDNLLLLSFQRPQLIFKHSTRCSISGMVKNRIDKTETRTDADFHYLDLIQFRSLSNLIAEKLSVHHESPQIILVKNGEATFDESHTSITMDEIQEQLEQ